FNTTAPGGTILALFQNIDPAHPTQPLWSSWDGVTVDLTTVIGKYTYYGDVNLDGQVTADDYATADVFRGLTQGALWTQGDISGDGQVTADDYAQMDVNRGQGVGNSVAPAILVQASASSEPVALNSQIQRQDLLSA